MMFVMTRMVRNMAGFFKKSTGWPPNAEMTWFTTPPISAEDGYSRNTCTRPEKMTHERKYGRYTQVCTTGLTFLIFSSLIISARNTLNVKPNARLYRLMSTVFLNARMKFGSTSISRK